MCSQIVATETNASVHRAGFQKVISKDTKAKKNKQQQQLILNLDMSSWPISPPAHTRRVLLSSEQLQRQQSKCSSRSASVSCHVSLVFVAL